MDYGRCRWPRLIFKVFRLLHAFWDAIFVQLCSKWTLHLKHDMFRQLSFLHSVLVTQRVAKFYEMGHVECSKAACFITIRLGCAKKSERIVNARVVDNVALGKSAVQLSTYLSPARAAVDGDVTTSSCTKDTAAQPWWAVDLGQVYDVGSLIITFPNFNGDLCNYRRRCFFC